MDHGQHNAIVSFIWGIADDVLRDVYVRGKYRDVILPMSTLNELIQHDLDAMNIEQRERIHRITTQLMQGIDGSKQNEKVRYEGAGFWVVIVERPLRLQIEFSPLAIGRLRVMSNDEDLIKMAEYLCEEHGPGPHHDYNAIRHHWYALDRIWGLEYTIERDATLRAALCSRNDAAAPVERSNPVEWRDQGAMPDRVFGGFTIGEEDGCSRVTEFESDERLRENLRIPLQEPGGIAGFIARVVIPRAPDAWVDASATRIGYEISHTR